MSLKTSTAGVATRAFIKIVIVAKTFDTRVVAFTYAQIGFVIEAKEILIFLAETVVFEGRYF
jgi:hypothetical protein